jgi:glycosyltransferase involved in cell wall biosynthesis
MSIAAHAFEIGNHPRVAIVHYWLLGRRGGEKVLEALCRMYPQADIYTLFYRPESVSPLLRSHNVIASFLNPFSRFHRAMLPLTPFALESFDLRPYDLVISSESGPAKGVLTPAATPHVCYCHTPMRYLWELYPAYRKDFSSPVQRAAMTLLTTSLRIWDYSTAARVDSFIANSRNVRQRIWKTYRRRSRVIYPPVEIERFSYRPSHNYFLMVAEFVAYKRLDYAIRTFAYSGRHLKIVGDGPDYSRLKSLSSPGIEFCGRVSDDELAGLYSGCTAFVMPGEEDFGITMVEALASGKPVIALARGGALEIVNEECGVLYGDASEASLMHALEHFDRIEGTMEPSLLQDRAGRFSESAFQTRFRSALAKVLNRSHGSARGRGPSKGGRMQHARI